MPDTKGTEQRSQHHPRGARIVNDEYLQLRERGGGLIFRHAIYFPLFLTLMKSAKQLALDKPDEVRTRGFTTAMCGQGDLNLGK